MWVGELLGSDGKVVKRFLLKGPVVNVGRAPDNSIQFESDKSISRLHAQIVLNSGPLSDDIKLIDLGSRFGSAVDGERVLPNTPFALQQGSRIKFGASSLRVQIVRQQLRLCMSSRLDRAQKDRLRAAAVQLGGRVESRPARATHMFATKMAATVKLLTALVLGIPAVTTDWIAFAESVKPAPVIPSET
ncbi:SMAD/FHA domain-containing protein, partial [Ochromonadaceae sp. CCMP2298]